MSPPLKRLFEGGIPVQHRRIAESSLSAGRVASLSQSSTESYALPRNTTFASDEYPGPYLHFGIVCSDQVIEVAAEHPPVVEVVESGDP